MAKKLKLPLDKQAIRDLRAGDRVLLSGTVYTARDAAHQRLYELIQEGKPLPFPIENQVIYYVGPTPAKPGQVIGSAGPTTSSRMDKYTPTLLEMGLKGMIGKGYRSEEVQKAIVEHEAVYFAAVGGAAALISKAIRSVEVISFHDLGTEAIHKLEVENFPAIVIHDVYGGDFYEEGVRAFQQ